MSLLDDVRALNANLSAMEEKVNLHEEQINGRRGVQSALNELAVEVRSLRKAAYWVGGIIVASSIGFAFGVLALVPG